MEIFIFPHELSLGTKVRMARVGRHWRQVDLAEEALVTQADVSALERDGRIYAAAERRILQSLGLFGEGIDHYEKLLKLTEGKPGAQKHYGKRMESLEQEMRRIDK